MTIEVSDQEADVVNCMRSVSRYGREQIVKVARALRTAEVWLQKRLPGK